MKPVLSWLSIFVLCSFQWLVLSDRRNNVCKTLPAYKYIYTSPKCYYNTNVLSNVSRMVKQHGYPLEKYKVVTEDGYILTLYRINNKRDSNRQPVLIQHGISASAAWWVLRDQDSLAFFLYDNGYDVWLSNIRGVTDSMGHVNVTISEKDYWNHSFHEMAIYDLPAITSFIAETTGQRGNIIYIGHSMGTTISYIYSSLLRDHAERHLKGIISMSPVAYFKNVKGLVRILTPITPALADLLKSFGFNALGNIPALNLLMQKLCSTYPTVYICSLLIVAIFGLAIEQQTPDLIPVITSYFPKGTSFETYVHFAQCVNNGGHFRQFDYGSKNNYRKYNSVQPPDYPVWKIRLPVFLFVGKQDFLADIADVEILRSKLTSSPIVEEYRFDFAHQDFILAKNINVMHNTLLNVLKRLK